MLVMVLAGAIGFVWTSVDAAKTKREIAYQAAHERCAGARNTDCQELATSIRAAVAAEDAATFSAQQLWLNLLGLIGLGSTVWFAASAWYEAKRSADADNEALKEMRAASAEARKDTAAQSKRLIEQLELADQTMQFTAKTAYAMSDSARHTRSVATAMRHSAEAISRQANIAETTARQQLRAYLYAEELTLSWGGDNDPPFFEITLRNTGQTPAINIGAGARAVLGGPRLLPPMPSKFTFGRDALIGAGATHKALLLVDDHDDIRPAQITPQNMIHVLGKIQYEDVFGGTYETEFAFFTTSPKAHEPMTVMAGHRAAFKKTGQREESTDNKPDAHRGSPLSRA